MSGFNEAYSRLEQQRDELLAACKAAAELYDRLSYGPLDGAAKFGDTWQPPSDDECIMVRAQLAVAIANSTDEKTLTHAEMIAEVADRR